ncbi:MAG: O-antigen ligase family protein [Pedobacter sp.]
MLVLIFLKKDLKINEIVFIEKKVKYYFTLVIVMTIGIPFSIYPRLSFNLLFFKYIVVVLFFIIFINIVNTIYRLKIMILLGCLGSGLYLTIALAVSNLGKSRLSIGDNFDPNDLAFFALTFLVLNLIFISADNPLWIRGVCAINFFVGVSAILLTGSRSGFLALGISIILLLLMKIEVLKTKHKLALVVLGVLLFISMPIDTDRYRSLISIDADYNVQDETGRLAIWGIGLRVMADNPLTGVGVGCFSNAVGLDREARGADTLRWQGAHNSVIQVGAETGIVGMYLFLLICYKVIRDFCYVKNRTNSINLVKIAQMGTIGFIGMFLSSMFLSQAYSPYLAFYIALSVAVKSFYNNEFSKTSGTKEYV